MNAKDLIRDWISYAKDNGISVSGKEGRSPTVGDVTKFMTGKGFDQSLLDGILDQIDTAVPASDDVNGSEAEVWWDQDMRPSAYDPEYQNDSEYDDDGDDKDDSLESDTEGTSSQNRTTGGVRDLEDTDAVVDDETRREELASAKRIIKKLSKAQQRQLFRELKHV